MNPAVACAKWVVLSAAVLSCQNTSSENQAAVEVSREAATPAASPAAAEPLPTPSPVQPQPAPSAAAPSAETSGEAAGKAAPTGALNAPASTASAHLAAPKANPSADTPSPTAPPGEAKRGTVVSEEPFSTWLEASSPLAAGSAASVDVVLVAKPPYHTNAEYPHKFKLSAAPPGLTYPEAVVKGMQVKPERSVLRVPVQAQQAGLATVSGTLSFSVCTEERCLVEKRDLSLALEIK